MLFYWYGDTSRGYDTSTISISLLLEESYTNILHFYLEYSILRILLFDNLVGFLSSEQGILVEVLETCAM